MRGDLGRGEAEEIHAHVAIQVHAFAVALVERLRQADGDTAEFGLRRGQHGVAEFEQAADAAAQRLAVQDDGLALGLERQLQALGLVRIGHGGDLRSGAADHQRMAAGRVHVHDAAILDDGGATGVAHQLGDQLVAAIEQVRCDAGNVGADRAVDLRDFPGQAVDLAGAGDQAVVDLVAEGVQVAVQLLEAVDQVVGVVEHAAAVGGAGGVGRQAADRIEEIGPDAVEVGCAVREQPIHPVGQPGKLLQPGQFAAAVEQARDRQLVGHAADVGDAGAVADIAIAHVGGVARGEVDLLPAVAVGLDVGHVVADGRQRPLEGDEGAATGGEDTGHRVLSQRRVMPARPAAWAKVWPRRVPAWPMAATARSMVGPAAMAAILAA